MQLQRNDHLKDLGLAVDFGTTAIGYAVVDKSTGDEIKTGVTDNPGRKYGRDVLSRIKAYSVGAADSITSAMRQALLDIGEYDDVVISANTAMNHMLLGLDCDGLSTAPYQAKTLNGNRFLLGADSYGTNRFARTLPGFSAYVGGDIISGVRALDMDKSEKINLLIDLGTNGEMVLGNKDGFMVTSVAAGPAFEEWGLTHGMYGSKVIDICHRLISTGIIGRDGAFASEKYINSGFPISSHSHVILSQDDIRNIQLAKAAVRAGVDILIKRTGISCDDVSEVYLAGGMGEHLSVESAVGIGMIPKELSSKIIPVGNSSLKGAIAELLDPDNDRLYAIQKMATPILLSDEPAFNDLYVSCMNF